MINAEQIRAARALLDWSTADLAQITGLTINGINKIEREHVNPQHETANLLQKTFEDAGIEFLTSGVKKKSHIIQVWNDEDAGRRLLDDVYYELRDTGGICLISSATETFGERYMGRKKIDEHKARLAKCGVTERLLIKEGDTNIIGPLESYRWVPEKYFSLDIYFIYGNKLAIVVREQPVIIIIINDARMAESVGKLFNFVWDHTKPLQLKA